MLSSYKYYGGFLNPKSITTSGQFVRSILRWLGGQPPFSFYSKELADGKCAVLEIKLWESSLEDNKISSVSDVKEIEARFEIKEGNNTIDEPVIRVIFD